MNVIALALVKTQYYDTRYDFLRAEGQHPTERRGESVSSVMRLSDTGKVGATADWRQEL